MNVITVRKKVYNEMYRASQSNRNIISTSNEFILQISRLQT